MYDSIELYFKYFNLLPANDLQKMWVKTFNEMSVHTRKRCPDDILLAARPNEEPHILKYRLANYEPITYELTNTALDRVFRVIGNNKYTIKANEQTLEYIKGKHFKANDDTAQDAMDLRTYLRKIAQKRAIEDPNGFIIWFPTGEGLIQPNLSIQPMPQLVYSSQFKYSDNNIFIYLGEEKTPLKGDRGETVMSGEVYWFITKTEYWKMYQVGTTKNPTWVQEMVYFHNLQELPIIVNGGDMNAGKYYESFFSPFLAFANDAIRQYSDWRAIQVTTGFPIKEEFATDCEIRIPIDAPGGLRAENIDPSEETNHPSKWIPISGKTPFNTYRRKVVPKGTEGMEAVLPAEIPSVRFIHPDVAVVKYAGESWEKLLERAESALNLKQKVDQAQSGKAKQLDKEDEYSLINKICDNFFDNILLNSLRYCDALLRNEGVDMSIGIIKPNSYNIKTEDDIVNELATLKEKKVPAIFLQQSTLDLANKRFSGDPLTEKIFDVVSTYDPLFIHDVDEQDKMVLSGRITKEMSQKSIMYWPILRQLAKEKTEQGLLEMSNEAIKVEFDKRFMIYYPSATPLTDEFGNTIGAT